MSRLVSRNDEPSQRLLRVGELVKQAMADILARGEIVDAALNCQPVTVPEVRMSPDLKLATICIMPLGGKDAQKILAALNLNKKQLRTLVAHRVDLKYAPELRFVLDESFAAHAHIDALLKSPPVARDLANKTSEGGDEHD